PQRTYHTNYALTVAVAGHLLHYRLAEDGEDQVERADDPVLGAEEERQDAAVGEQHRGGLGRGQGRGQRDVADEQGEDSDGPRGEARRRPEPPPAEEPDDDPAPPRLGLRPPPPLPLGGCRGPGSPGPALRPHRGRRGCAPGPGRSG